MRLLMMRALADGGGGRPRGYRELSRGQWRVMATLAVPLNRARSAPREAEDRFAEGDEVQLAGRILGERGDGVVGVHEE